MTVNRLTRRRLAAVGALLLVTLAGAASGTLGYMEDTGHWSWMAFLGFGALGVALIAFLVSLTALVLYALD